MRFFAIVAVFAVAAMALPAAEPMAEAHENVNQDVEDPANCCL
jgi:hypothetical protein